MSSSYDSDDGPHLADLLGPSLEEFRDDEQHLENILLEEVSSVECHILAYVCKDVLLGNDQCYNTLIELKEYVKGATNLLRPSAAVMNLFIRYDEHFE
ncbi:hypothetical protein MTO96_040847 [Rhipicephalus appendiculatus]